MVNKMNDSTSNQEHKSTRTDHHEEPVGQLIKAAGPNIELSDDRAARMREMVKGSWQQGLQRRRFSARRSALIWAVSAAASVFAVALLIQFVSPVPQVDTSVIAAKVTMVKGTAHIEQDSPLALTRAMLLYPGQSIRTGPQSGLALQLGRAQSLRLDAETQLIVLAPRQFRLKTGAVYYDGSNKNQSIQIDTPAGVASDLGTQFEVRVKHETVRLRVREGEVKLEGRGPFADTQYAKAKDELLISGDGKISKAKVEPDSPEWSWAQSLSPGFDLEGRSLHESLRWLARENGWALQYVNPALEQEAVGSVLHGSIDKLSAIEALNVVTTIGGVVYQLRERVLLIENKQ
jgi:FecR protein